jgi:Lsr2
MAQQTTVTLTDDIDGGKAAETVSFGLDGKAYEIDLSKKNAAALRKALADFTTAGRRVRPSRQVARAARPASATSVDAKAIREWAIGQGISVSARGRVPADVVEQYNSSLG